MDPISALISGGLSLVNGLFSGFGAQRNTDANNQASERAAQIYNEGQMELAKYQNEYNLAMWNRQNEYNSPEAQMQRYREAGLNPNLIYGNGSSSAGNSSSSPMAAQADFMAPQYREQDNGWQTAAQSFLAAEQAFSTIGLQETQADFNEAKILETIQGTQQRAAQTELTILQQAAQAIQNETNEATKRALIDYYFLRNDSLASQIRKNTQDISESASRIEKNRSEVEVNTQRKLEIKARTGLSIAQTNSVYTQIKKAAHEIMEIDSRRSLNNQQYQFNQETFATRADQLEQTLANSIQRNSQGELEINARQFQLDYEKFFGHKMGSGVWNIVQSYINRAGETLFGD